MLHLRLTDRDVERVLAGHQPHGRPDLAEVARFVAQLRAVGTAEQPPPMSPRLLAELDAAELAHRHGRQAEDRRRDARVARRRWRMVGAVAVVVMLGGLVAAGLRDASRGAQTEIGDTGAEAEDEAESEAPVPEETPTTAAPQPSTTQATQPPPTTAAPEPAPAPPSSQSEGVPSGVPGRVDHDLPRNWPGAECFDEFVEIEDYDDYRKYQECWDDVYHQADEGGYGGGPRG